MRSTGQLRLALMTSAFITASLCAAPTLAQQTAETEQASNVDDVAEWMNFVYDPVNAAQITAAVQFISPVQGVQEQLRKMGGEDAALADSPLLFPDDATKARLHTFANLSDDQEAKFDEEFSKISGA